MFLSINEHKQSSKIQLIYVILPTNMLLTYILKKLDKSLTISFFLLSYEKMAGSCFWCVEPKVFSNVTWLTSLVALVLLNYRESLPCRLGLVPWCHSTIMYTFEVVWGIVNSCPIVPNSCSHNTQYKCHLHHRIFFKSCNCPKWNMCVSANCMVKEFG